MQRQDPYLNNAIGGEAIRATDMETVKMNGPGTVNAGLPASAATFQSRMMVLECTSALVAQTHADDFPLSRSGIEAKGKCSRGPRGSSPCSAATKARSCTPDSEDNDMRDQAAELSQLADQWQQRRVLSEIGTSASHAVFNGALVFGEVPGGASDRRDANDEDDGEEEFVLPPPPNKPRRPLSAYNLFFKYERARLLIFSEGGEKSLEDAPPTPSDVSASDVRSLLENNPYHVDRDKRRHRKSHGRVSFRELTKIILKNWKAVDPLARTAFESLAAEHKAEYEGEAADYKAWKAQEQRLRARNKRKVAKALALQQAATTMASSVAAVRQEQGGGAAQRNVRRRTSAPGALIMGLAAPDAATSSSSSAVPTAGAFFEPVDGSSRRPNAVGAFEFNPLPPPPPTPPPGAHAAFPREHHDAIEPVPAFSGVSVRPPNFGRRPPLRNPLPPPPPTPPPDAHAAFPREHHDAIEPIPAFSGVSVRPPNFGRRPPGRRISCPADKIENDSKAVLSFLQELDWDQLDD